MSIWSDMEARGVGEAQKLEDKARLEDMNQAGVSDNPYYTMEELKEKIKFTMKGFDETRKKIKKLQKELNKLRF